MSNRRLSIPKNWRDTSKWDRPVLSLHPNSVRAIYGRHERALELYAADASFSEIELKTSAAYMGDPTLPAAGLSRHDVARLIRRALRPNGRGGIIGFFAAIPDLRVASYTRKAPSVNDRILGGRGGLSGSFGKLITDYPKLGVFIKKALLGAEPVPQTRASIRAIHRRAKKYLIEELKFTQDQYPLNTRTCGYQSFRKFCAALIEINERGWVSARGGETAATRLAVGTGFDPILPCLRPFEFGEIDYHTVDDICEIMIETEKGMIPMLIKRIHVGAIIDNNVHAAVGCHVSLEQEITTDDFLSTLQSSIAPPEKETRLFRFEITADGYHLPNQLEPALAYQCFSILSVDGALANKSNEAVNAVIEICGGIVKLSGPRQWYSRALVERLFLEMTARGIQLLPSTTGSHPRDSKRDDPDAKAIKFRISLTDLISCLQAVIRHWNETPSAGIMYCAPMESLRYALESSSSKYIWAPLPKERQTDSRIMYHSHECRIGGSKIKGRRPYVECHGAIFRSPELANAWNLIGESAILYVNRTDIRFATHLILADGSRQFLELKPDRRWMIEVVSWRDLVLISKFGAYKREANMPTHPMDSFHENKRKELADAASEGRIDRKLALAVANHEMKRQKSGKTEPETGMDSDEDFQPASYPKRHRFDEKDYL